MAIRYSGDVEVRLTFANGLFRGSVRAPGFRASGTVTPQEAGLTRKHRLDSSESYDAAATEFLKQAVTLRRDLPVSRDGASIVLRRTFQAPCPMRGVPRGKR